MLPKRLAFASAALLALVPAMASAAPVTIPKGVAAPLPGSGTGLCAASAKAMDATIEFGLLNPNAYTGNINAFIEAHKADRVETVIRTLLDLSNNNLDGKNTSYGDFVNSVAGCQPGGCDFYVNDATTSFATRFRGYFNVTEALAGKPIHFGFYADDAVSLTFFGAMGVQYPVIVRPAQIGTATWRLTETVTFSEPGLYPVEILYIEIVTNAALEMSYFIGDFTDFQRPSEQAPVIKLGAAGFTLAPPTDFFQTLSGAPSFQDVNQCQQCDRQFVNQASNNGCQPGYFCNDAALCAPCDTDKFCGPSCSPCMGDTPFCINLNGQNTCAGCRDDKDCKSGFTCDPVQHTCHECNEDTDCAKGKSCSNHTCVTCDTADSCAGNSCNCCPPTPAGKAMTCAALELNGQPRCVECAKNEDCGGNRVCDLNIGRCFDQLPNHETADCCGDSCVQCPPDTPFCLPGPIGNACAQCRSDADCGDGKFCLSGTCATCTRDRRCGLRCDSCGGDTPFCDGQSAEVAKCVRCTDDSQCNGGTCNKQTHECAPTCAQSCAPNTPHCDGTQCVACYADTQCPCGGTCNLTTHTCSSACKKNVDCLGNEHCRWTEDESTKECALGPMPDGVDCGGTLATLCSARPGQHGGGAPSAGLLALSILALMGRRGHRRGRGES
jgi:outer membrane exchange protein TraA